MLLLDPSGNLPQWAERLIGGALVVGAIALTICTVGVGGVFAGIQYGLSASKLANSVSGLSKSQSKLNSTLKPLGNVKNLSKMPFSNANIAKLMGQTLENYNSAYSSYIIAKGTYIIAKVGIGALYFVAESLTSYLIGLMF